MNSVISNMTILALGYRANFGTAGEINFEGLLRLSKNF